MISLPWEVVMEIALHLDGASLISLCQTSQHMALLCEEEYVWKRKYFRDFDLPAFRVSGKTWREKYAEAFRLKPLSISALFSKYISYTDIPRLPDRAWSGPSVATRRLEIEKLWEEEKSYYETERSRWETLTSQELEETIRNDLATETDVIGLMANLLGVEEESRFQELLNDVARGLTFSILEA